MTLSFESDLPPSEAIDAAPLLRGIVDWVEMETPSDRPDLIDVLLDSVEASFEGLPVQRRRVPGRDGCGGQLILRYAPAGVSGAPLLFMGHVDTVWDAGTLAERPVRREGDQVFGPGIFDMKAGSYLATETVRRIAAAGLIPPRPIIVYLNADEEIGSLTSRDTIEELAREAALVLVPEPSVGAAGTVVTARKGWARFSLVAQGVSAHAGGNLADGRSAIREIAQHILQIESLNDTEPAASFNVGTVAGGTRANVVPDHAAIEIDMRVEDMPTAERLIAEMLDRRAVGKDIALHVSGGLNRPPFVRSPAVHRLYEATCALAKYLKLPMAEASRGGVSDGNFAAALGKPVLDGLGCSGGGAHALHEHILVSTIAPRAALMHAMAMSKTFQTLAVD
ncbi:M20 family metallopeptidase [Pseudohoeflea coraliihabitans]|uniref:M20 family metallopeptidase n=1 Tax=Pseudohoeflea coraliihabitans TaxID=2860393 RepID=A0ABS6WND1_9HYPH|nr:M20 family metallopeptidase [Pseudohoeflea sp. DP4N28-3]MBW3097472.1 M20 family metallopeptidase [Pseudohoeflea sp. DP4N28-3]